MDINNSPLAVGIILTNVAMMILLIWKVRRLADREMDRFYFDRRQELAAKISCVPGWSAQAWVDEDRLSITNMRTDTSVFVHHCSEAQAIELYDAIQKGRLSR